VAQQPPQLIAPIPVLAQEANGPNLNLNLQLDLNLDPVEVIINPANDNEEAEVEQLIPQQVQYPQAPLQLALQIQQINDEANHFMNGGQIPQLPDLIGEEVPLDQLIDNLVEIQQQPQQEQEEENTPGQICNCHHHFWKSLTGFSPPQLGLQLTHLLLLLPWT
jgi:hypothetical protein